MASKGVDQSLVDKMLQLQQGWAGLHVKDGPGPEEKPVWGEALGGK